MPKAKITKLKEDQILNNGSKDTVFPVTLGEAVQVKEDPNSNARETLAERLLKLRANLVTINNTLSTHSNSLLVLETLCRNNIDEILNRIGYLYLNSYVDEEDENKIWYEILGFTNAKHYNSWALIYATTEDPKLRAKADDDFILSRTAAWCVEYEEDTPEPEDPPLEEIPTLLSPNDGDSVVVLYDEENNYTDDRVEGYFQLAGMYLKENLVVTSENRRFLFAIRDAGGNMSYNSRLTFGNNINLVNAEGGVEISVIPNRNLSYYTQNDVISDKITISSKEIETVTLDASYTKSVENTPTIVEPSNIPIAIALDNINEHTKFFNLHILDLASDIVVATTNTSFYLCEYDEEIPLNAQRWANSLTISSTKAAEGLKIAVTCRYYKGQIIRVPERNYNFNITVTDNAEFNATLSNVVYEYTIGNSGDVEVDITQLDLYNFKIANIPISYTFPDNVEATLDFVIEGWPNNLSLNINGSTISVIDSKAFSFYIRSSNPLVPADSPDYYTYSGLQGNSYAVRGSKDIVIGVALSPDYCDALHAANIDYMSGKISVETKDIKKEISCDWYYEDTPANPSPSSLVVDNPTLTEQLYYMAKSFDRDYIGDITSTQGLTQDQVDTVLDIPEYAFINVEVSEENIDFDVLDLSFFVNLKRIQAHAFENCSNLTTVILPPHLESIGDYAFSGTNIDSIILPNSVTHLGNAVFGGCINLRALAIPDSVTRLPHRLCSGCNNLETIDFGQNITGVASGFEDCDNLSTIVLRSTEVVLLSARMQLGIDNQIGFSKKIQVNGENNDNLTIYVPSDLLTSYQNGMGNWATYFGNDVFDTIDNLPSDDE